MQHPGSDRRDRTRDAPEPARRLIDLQRLEAGEVTPTFQPTDLATMTADVAGIVGPAAQAAGVELRVRCDPLGRVVYVDREMWEQVVLNLCAAALESTPRGSITVRLFGLDDAARLEVMDTGRGIGPARLARAVGGSGSEVARQAGPGDGPGLRLALAGALVRLHGGSLEAGSVPGQGTTVAVTLPFGAAHLDPAHLASTATRTGRRLQSCALDGLDR